MGGTNSRLGGTNSRLGGGTNSRLGNGQKQPSPGVQSDLKFYHFCLQIDGKASQVPGLHKAIQDHPD